MGGLTEEQKRRIEENRRRALQRRAQNFAQKGSVAAPTNQAVQKPTWQQGVPAKTTHQSSAYNRKPTFTGTSSKIGSSAPNLSNSSTSSNNAGNGKTFTGIHPPSSDGRVLQWSPVKPFVGSNTTSTSQSSSNSTSSRPVATCSSSSSNLSNANSSAKTYTSVHSPPLSGGPSAKSSTNNVSRNLISSNPGFQSKPDSAKTFVPYGKSASTGNVTTDWAKTFQSYNKNVSTGSTTTQQPGTSNAPVKPSFEASKSTISFYSSKPANNTNPSKPSFTSSSNSSFKSFSSHNSNQQQQKQWQKFQPSGSPSRSGNGPSGSIGSTAYGGGLTGKCVLISKKRFEVDVTYHAKLIEFFKQMSTKSYNAVTKKWSFSLSEYDQLMNAVKCLRPAVEIQPLPKALCIAFRAQRCGQEESPQVPDANLNSVDSKLVNALMPFQREGVNFAVAHEGRVLIADEMGLGKTIQAICIAYYYRTEWPLLIVTPSSLRYSWAEALEKWLPSLDPDEINVVLTGKDDVTAGLVNILSYDLMARKVNDLTKVGFQVIILDESHFMKNIKTARSKAALAILKGAPRVLLLSGTPALSRPAELFTQVKAVRPNLFPSNFHEFGVRYCDAKQNNWGWDYSGSSNLCELQLLMEETIMIRRMKADVLTQLPSKTRQMVLMDPQTVKTNSKALKSAAKEMSQKKSNSEQRGALMQYFNETGHAKIPAIKDYVLDVLESGCKILVFAHHKLVLDAVCESVKAKKYKYIRIDGSTSAAKRKQQVDDFQEQEEYRVAVLSITAANAGLTLTAASLVVFAELFWNPGIMIQAEDRVHRIGQKDCVDIRYLIAKGTADDYIWPLVQKKLTVLEKAGLSRDDFSEADTTTFEDPRQRKILSFFEQSFFEADEENAMAELAVLEAAEADGTTSQSTEEDSVPTKSTADCGKLSHNSTGYVEKQSCSKEKQSDSRTHGKRKTTDRKPTVGQHHTKETQSHSRTHEKRKVFDQKPPIVEKEHVGIKRLAKSTHRKFDLWRKKSEEEQALDEQVIDELVNDDDAADLDAAVLEDEDSDEDSPSIFETSKPKKTLFSGAQKGGGFVPPFKKQRHL